MRCNNSNDSLISFSSAYLTEQGGFGEIGSNAVEKHKYLPALNSGAEVSVYDPKTGKTTKHNLIENSRKNIQ